MPVCELDASGNVAAENIFGAWGLVSRQGAGGGTAFYAFDERGNVAQRTDGSGSLLSTDLYDSYGKKRSGPADVWGFGGQAGYYTDTETGLILCTHRFYDTQSGRFLTRDPLGYAGGINLYTRNKIVGGLDPDGSDAAPLPFTPPTTAILSRTPGRRFFSLNTQEGNIWSGGVVRPDVISLSLSLRVRKSS